MRQGNLRVQGLVYEDCSCLIHHMAINLSLTFSELRNIKVEELYLKEFVENYDGLFKGV